MFFSQEGGDTLWHIGCVSELLGHVFITASEDDVVFYDLKR